MKKYQEHVEKTANAYDFLDLVKKIKKVRRKISDLICDSNRFSGETSSLQNGVNPDKAMVITNIGGVNISDGRVSATSFIDCPRATWVIRITTAATACSTTTITKTSKLETKSVQTLGFTGARRQSGFLRGQRRLHLVCQECCPERMTC